MKRLLALLAMTSFAWISHAGVHPDKEYETFFHSYLIGKSEKIPEKNIKAKHLEKYRKKVWDSWKEANLNDDTFALPDLDKLEKKVSGKWALPSELEPHAVLPFYWGYKGNKPENGYPLFLYLHGSGPKTDEWETGHKLAQLFDDAPCIYFIPQIPNEGPWYRWWQLSKQFAWEKLLRTTLLRKDVNPDRLYVFGISEGGYGSQRLASFYADYWAAAGPMAGGEPLKNAPTENLANIGFSLRTGAQDFGFYRNILTEYTAESLDSLQDLFPEQFKHTVKLIPDKGHHIDYRPTTPWMSQFTRNPWPKHFTWEDFEMDGRHRQGFYNLLIKKRPDDTLRTHYEMDINDNVIRVTVANVIYETSETDSIYGIEMKFNKTLATAEKGKATIFLNEHLVDFNNPVQVFVNDKLVYNSKVHLNVKNLLWSTTVFYDPKRLFPAAIDIEF